MKTVLAATALDVRSDSIDDRLLRWWQTVARYALEPFMADAIVARM